MLLLVLFSALLDTSRTVHGWQYQRPLEEIPEQLHKWVDARTILGANADYGRIERDMGLINRKTLSLLRTYGCPLRHYIERIFLDTASQNSLMIEAACSTGTYWFLYNGVISGQVKLLYVYDSDPFEQWNQDYF